MNRDVLIQKYLDNDLTLDEMNEFNQLFVNDPEFQKDANELLKVESNLDLLMTPVTAADISVIDNVYNRITTAPGSDKKLIFNKFSKKKFVILSLILLTIISLITIMLYDLWMNYDKTMNNKVVNNKKTDELINQTKSANQFNREIDNSKDKKPRKTVSKDEVDNNTVQSEKLADNRTNNLEQNELNVSIKQKEYQKNDDILIQLISDLNKFISNSDNLNSANTAKRIGLFLINLKNDYPKGLSYLYQSIEYAKKTHNAPFLAEILGETGKMEIQGGDREKGKVLIQNCIEIYEKENLKISEFWKEYIIKKFPGNN